MHDPTDPVGRLLFNVLGIAEFESDLMDANEEGMKVAEAKGRLHGKQPEPAQEAHLVELWRTGKHTRAALAELFLHGPSDRLPRSGARRRNRRLFGLARRE